MSAAYMIGFGSGIIIVGVMFLLGALLYKKKNPGPCKYDERQELARGKAFKVGFFTLLFYNVIYGMATVVTEMEIFDTMAAMITGVFLSLGVFACNCIWNDAYMSLNEKPGSVCAVLGCMGGINFLCGIASVISGDMIENGQITFHFVNLMCGVVMLFLLVVFVIKQKKNKIEAE